MDTRDPAVALRELPVQMSFERSMLSYLHARPGDYAGALQQSPPRLLSMFVSAFQSYLFNCALSTGSPAVKPSPTRCRETG